MNELTNWKDEALEQLKALQNQCKLESSNINLPKQIEGVKNPRELARPEIVNGISTGYITHDYNDNGLKPGCLTVLTGKTGSGKTTYVKSIVIAAAMHQVGTYMFVGENTIEKEKEKLAKIRAPRSEITSREGLAGSLTYHPSDKAIQIFDDTLSDYIHLSDLNTLKNVKTHKTIFGKILIEMQNLANYFKVKLFILDNLMTLCEKTGNNLFSEQKQIALALKDFVNKTQTHVILIAHPKKGEGNQDISGATEVINLCDTILRYGRVNEQEIENLIKKNPDKESFYRRVSGKLVTEKYRDDGHSRTAWFEWDQERGILFDLSELSMATIYERDGFWTRAFINKKY